MIDLSHPETLFAVEVLRMAARLAERVKAGIAMYQMTKADLSPVTVADYAVQACVAHGLQCRFPGAALVAEERADALRAPAGELMQQVVTRFVAEEVPGATEEQVCDWIDLGAGEPGSQFWTLDPIDGTKGYVRGGQYAVALALIEDGRVVLGALACPGLGTDCQPGLSGEGALLVARRGEGAWVTSIHGDSRAFQPLHVSGCAEGGQARILRSYEASHTNEGEIDQIARQLGTTAEPVLLDSQAKYAVLAAGGAEILLRLLSPKQADYRERIWDQAAGAIILEEAGGRITDLLGRPLDFGRGRLLADNTGVFASNGPLHDGVVRVIAQVCSL